MSKVTVNDYYVALGMQQPTYVFSSSEMEAYAAAKVREALKDAAKVCEARIGTGDPGIDTEDADTEAKECAMAIRALIQNQ